MRALLDTCVISELSRPAPEPRVLAALRRIAEPDLFLSVVTLGELVRGISLLPEGRRQGDLAAWLAELRSSFSGRLLPVDAETAEIWGRISAEARRAGRTVGAPDGLIAATAIRHGLHVFTRNTSDFAPTGAMLHDPWA